MMIDNISEYDRRFMLHCLTLARQAKKLGEFPFVSIVVRDGEIISEAINEVSRTRDLTRHAELISISRALRATGLTRLRGCAIYTTVEPCPMCSFAIREARINRVVYALASPLMGGASRWSILADEGVSRAIPEIFGRRPPVVVGGVLAADAADVWRADRPFAWIEISRRGCFTCESPAPADFPAKGRRRAGVFREMWRSLRARGVQSTPR
jgi:tRNA(adenine34) deaminase